MAYLGVSPSNGVRKVHTYTVSGSSTNTFSGVGAENISLSYRDSTYIDVYQNGVKLGDADYTATNGTSVVLGTNASDGDIVVVVVYDVFSVADTVSKTDGGQFDGNVTMAGTLGVTGAVTANAGVVVDNITIDGTEIDLSSGNLTLDIAGQLVVNSDSGQVVLQDDTVNWGNLQNSSGDFIIGSLGTDKDIKFQGLDGSSTITAMTIDMSEGGNVGIGTSSPSSDAGLSRILQLGSSSDTSTTFVLKDDDGDFEIGSAGGSLRIYDDGTERVRLDSSGKVGIGTSSPDSLLSVCLTDGTGTYFEGGGTASSADARRLLISASTTTNAGDTHTINAESSTGNLAFATANTERMRIQPDGTVSIGVSTDADAKLFASRGDAGDTAMFESTSSASSGVIAIRTSIGQNNNNTNSQHLFAITQNVASFKLHGNGSSTFSSDERLKKNIETTRDGYLEDLAKLRVVKYNWHCDDDSTDKELGLIAQEVQKVFPKLVVEDDVELNGIEKPLALKFSVLPMMLLKALQEANTKIEALEARITTLEGE